MIEEGTTVKCVQHADGWEEVRREKRNEDKGP